MGLRLIAMMVIFLYASFYEGLIMQVGPEEGAPSVCSVWHRVVLPLVLLLGVVGLWRDDIPSCLRIVEQLPPPRMLSGLLRCL